MTTHRYRRGWRIMGEIFGFPPCCIAEFESRDISPYYWNWLHDPFFRPSGMPPYWWDGTGFIPCKACLGVPQEKMLQYIAANRLAPHPFPNDDLGSESKRIRKMNRRYYQMKKMKRA